MFVYGYTTSFYSWLLYSLILENTYTKIKIYVKSITLAL